MEYVNTTWRSHTAQIGNLTYYLTLMKWRAFDFKTRCELRLKTLYGDILRRNSLMTFRVTIPMCTSSIMCTLLPQDNVISFYDVRLYLSFPFFDTSLKTNVIIFRHCLLIFQQLNFALISPGNRQNWETLFLIIDLQFAREKHSHQNILNKKKTLRCIIGHFF